MLPLRDGRADCRLTWCAGAPLPYESGWSMFLRLLTLNIVPPHVLLNAVGKEAPYQWRTPLDWVSSRWIDFERLSRALDVGAQPLREGFLDQHLAVAPIKLEPIPTIFHCQDCLKFGYHSVFFELAAIDTCPWHGKRLAPCRNCATAVQRRHPKFKGGRDGENLIFAPACGHFAFSAENPPVRSVPTEAMLHEIAVRGREMSQWLMKVSSAKACDEKLLEPLWWVGARQHASFERIALAWELARQTVGEAPWPVSWHITNMQTTVLEPDMGTEKVSRAAISPRGPFGVVYQAVRRAIEKRYIAPHSQCLRSMERLCGAVQPVCIDGNICSVSLAYLTWRRRIERIDEVAPKDSGEFLRPHGLGSCGREGVALSYLLLFYALWEDIEHYIDNPKWERAAFMAELDIPSVAVLNIPIKHVVSDARRASGPVLGLSFKRKNAKSGQHRKRHTKRRLIISFIDHALLEKHCDARCSRAGRCLSATNAQTSPIIDRVRFEAAFRRYASQWSIEGQLQDVYLGDRPTIHAYSSYAGRVLRE